MHFHKTKIYLKTSISSFVCNYVTVVIEELRADFRLEKVQVFSCASSAILKAVQNEHGEKHFLR